MRKITYNLLVFENFAEEFEKWHSKTAGGKGEKASGAMMALMAIHRLDEALAFALMDPELTAEKAAKLIYKTIQEKTYRDALADLTPEQRAQLLRDAKSSKRKVLGKKKK